MNSVPVTPSIIRDKTLSTAGKTCHFRFKFPSPGDGRQSNILGLPSGDIEVSKLRVINVSGKSIFTTVWKHLGIIVDIIQETNVKERILTVKQNSNVVNNTLQESEYSDWNHMVDCRWKWCRFRNLLSYQEFFIFMAPGVKINSHLLAKLHTWIAIFNECAVRLKCSVIYTCRRCRYILSSIVDVNSRVRNNLFIDLTFSVYLSDRKKSPLDLQIERSGLNESLQYG